MVRDGEHTRAMQDGAGGGGELVSQTVLVSVTGNIAVQPKYSVRSCRGGSQHVLISLLLQLSSDSSWKSLFKTTWACYRMA